MVAQKKHLKSKNKSAGKHCCQGDIYARNSPLTNIKANSAGPRVSGLTWLAELLVQGREKGLCQGSWLPFPLPAITLPACTGSYSKVKNSYCRCTHTAKGGLSLCVLNLSSAGENAANAEAATFALMTANREKQLPKWSGRITKAEKIPFYLCMVICCQLPMAWLWYCLFLFLS